MATVREKNIVSLPVDEVDRVRKAVWSLIQGVEAQRTFAEMLIHSEGMEESDAPTTGDIAHMVAGMAERLDLQLNHVKRFVFDQVGSAKP